MRCPKAVASIRAAPMRSSAAATRRRRHSRSAAAASPAAGVPRSCSPRWSGCGKTTLGRMILRLLAPTAGRISFRGEDITHRTERALKPVRGALQAVFQDPVSSLNPRLRVRDIIGEPLVNRGGPRDARAERIAELLSIVGLPGDAGGRFPHEFSGGQRQRIAIARALSVNPALIVCDEAVSALDLSVQAQILNLLRDLQTRYQ